MLDGEIVIATARGLDFDALQLRLHPAASRVAKLAAETPSSFVAFDVLAIGDEDLRDAPQHERRPRLEQLLANAKPPIHLTPMTRDPQLAADWLRQFEGAGLDGVIAKPVDGVYQPGKRVDDQGEARPDRRLRRGRLPLAQDRERQRSSARCCSDSTI